MIIFWRVGLLFFFCWYSMILSVWTQALCCSCCCWSVVQYSVVSDSLRPHGLQHARLPCPSPSPRLAQSHVHWVGDAILISGKFSEIIRLIFLSSLISETLWTSGGWSEFILSFFSFQNVSHANISLILPQILDALLYIFHFFLFVFQFDCVLSVIGK